MARIGSQVGYLFRNPNEAVPDPKSYYLLISILEYAQKGLLHLYNFPVKLRLFKKIATIISPNRLYSSARKFINHQLPLANGTIATSKLKRI